MNNKKTRLQRFISSLIAVLLFAAIALGAALPAAASITACRLNKKSPGSYVSIQSGTELRQHKFRGTTRVPFRH